MSQRNPLNERYQNADERKGATRKSAASAKPASKAASSVRVERKVEEPKGLFARATQQANKSNAARDHRKQQASKQSVQRRKENAIRTQYYNPPTPEYKRWKKVWWAMLGGAIALTAFSFWASGQESLQSLMYPTIGLSYALLFLAIVLEFTFLRKLRRTYQDEKIAEEFSKKRSKARKEAAEAARLAAKEAEEAPPQEERKLFRGLFTRKRASDAVATAKGAQALASADGAADDAAAEAAADIADAAAEKARA